MIQQTLAEHGLAPNRRLGQNFLIDRNLMQKLVDSAEIKAKDTVLEVGGGTGGLTDQLAVRAGHLVVAEADAGLARLLADRYQERANVDIIHTDILKGKHEIAPAVIEKICETEGDRGFLLVANLPYNIASPLLMNLLMLTPRVKRMCFTIQREVADRITARAGSKDVGPLSIALQLACDIEVVAHLPPSVFWPPPKIDSSMLRLDIKPDAIVPSERFEQFVTLVRTAFAHRRKTLRSNLSSLPERTLEIVQERIDLSQRAEQIPLATWQDILSSMRNDGG